MKTTILPEHPDAKSPAGADIRFVMACEAGNMIHSTVPPQQVNRATMHATVSELWFVLEGRGEIWRNDGDESCVTALVPGTSVDIPVGTAFHLRLHAALAGRLGGDVRRREVAAHDLTGREDGSPRAYARVRQCSGMSLERVSGVSRFARPAR
jgi:quercetin dioxygenase-like cupin family protein